MYGVADAVHTLFNQELTNREKRNFHARAYDREMFPDVAALDKAQTRPDPLVPADTRGGARNIAEGIYSFETAELSGTINLIEWINGPERRRDRLSIGGVQNLSKKAIVVFCRAAEHQQTPIASLIARTFSEHTCPADRSPSAPQSGHKPNSRGRGTRWISSA